MSDKDLEATSSDPEFTPDPVPDPGLPPHHWRPTDVDPKAERRAERQVAAWFIFSALCTVAFVYSYFAFQIGDNWDTFLGLGASTLFLGLSLSGALLGIGIGVIQWARKLMGDQEIVEMRHSAASSEEDREKVLGMIGLGIEEASIARRPLVRNSLLGAMALIGVAPIVMLRDLGPLPQDVDNAEEGLGLAHTVWRKGMRVVTGVTGRPLRPSDLQIGDLVNAAPEIEHADVGDWHQLHGHELLVSKAKSALILLRMEPRDLNPWEGREDWDVEGIVAYSKICTHVGCPISLNERTTHNLLCPCHQTTFDLADNGKVIFGPGARALPQLPLAVDPEGFLVAQSDFTEPVGPSYWERDSK